MKLKLPAVPSTETLSTRIVTNPRTKEASKRPPPNTMVDAELREQREASNPILVVWVLCGKQAIQS